MATILNSIKGIMARRLVFIFFAFISSTVFTQVDEEEKLCGGSENNKATDLFEKGSDKKKNDKAKRIDFLRQALEIDDNYVDAHYLYALEVIRTAKYQGSSLAPAEEHLLKVIEGCPDYHSDPYYYLGEFYYGKGNYAKSAEYYKKFIDFPTYDESKFSKSYEKNLDIAKVDYKYAHFYADVYSNPVPFNPVLVANVSTEVDEYLPLISPDDERMYFTRRFVKNNRVRASSFESDKPEYIERFSVANHMKSEFDEGEPMKHPFNQVDNYNYGGATISIDNKHLFLTICQPGKGGYINCDLYSSDLVYGYSEKEEKDTWYWTELQNLGPEVNGETSWEGQPSLSADGKTLFFASARQDSRMIDIYISERNSDGTWQTAKNLGSTINSEYSDKSPFIHSDSRTLYFASQGHIGLGGFDIFYSKMKDDGTWQEPKNIGYPINSKGDEHGFVVSTDGKRVYLGSDILKELGGGLDIYTFELYEGARPQKVVFVKGNLQNENGSIPNNTEIELKNIVSNEINRISFDSADGSYAAVMVVEKDDDIILNVRGKNQAFNSQIISSKKGDGVVKKISIKVEEVKVGKSYKINDINYSTNSAEISPLSKNILKEFASYLLENKTLNVEVRGHTDNQGNDELNLALSSDRAFSVLSYLQVQGVEISRLTFKGFGSSMPIATNDTEEGRATNRRTEFMIVSK